MSSLAFTLPVLFPIPLVWDLAAGGGTTTHCIVLLLPEDGTPYDSNSTLLYVPSFEGMFLFFQDQFL